MQEELATNLITKKTTPLKVTITGSEAISVLNPKNLEDFNPYERLAHVKSRLTQRKNTVINDNLKRSCLLYDNPQYKLASKPQSLSYDNPQCKLPTKRPSAFYISPSSYLPIKEALQRRECEPANQHRIELLNKNLNEIPKASIKVGRSQPNTCLSSNNTINKQLPHDGEVLGVKQFYSTIKVPHSLTNEIPKASIKAGKRQCLSSNIKVFKQLPHERELLLAARESTSTANVLHNPTNEIPKASIKVGESQQQKYNCLLSNNTVYKQLSSDEGELLREQQTHSTVNEPHSPTNETTKASIKVGETQKQQCKSLSFNYTIKNKLPNEREFLAAKQITATVNVPHNPINETPKVPIKVGKSQCLSSNNTIYKPIPLEGEVLAVKRFSFTVNVSHNPTNEIPKASIKVGESQQQKYNCLPLNNTVYKQLSSDEGELLTEQHHSTVSVPQSPTCETPKVSIKVGESQNQQYKCLSLNNTINKKLPNERELLAENKLYSTVKVPHNPSNEIPKASVKVDKECLSSNNTIYKKVQHEGKVSHVEQFYSTVNVSHNPANDIPKASIKAGKSQQHKCLSPNKTIIEPLPLEGEQLNVKQIYSMINMYDI